MVISAAMGDAASQNAPVGWQQMLPSDLISRSRSNGDARRSNGAADQNMKVRIRKAEADIVSRSSGDAKRAASDQQVDRTHSSVRDRFLNYRYCT